MDLGGVGLDGLMVGSEAGFVPPSSDPETRQKFCGSGFFKQGRSTTVDDDDLIRGSKVAKINAEDASGAMLLQEQRSNTPLLLLRSNNNNNNSNNNGATTFFSTVDDCGQQQQMLSFSNPKSETLSSSSSNAATLSYFNYHQHPLSSYSRNNAGYNSWGNMHGGRGAASIFTASQWVELEQQALIYKYITANVPVPSHLLNPIRKALDSAAFCNFSNPLLRPPNALGWGGFHLGFSSSTDPEPGRCRRTDGKKWRCSRDAVVDQKYCERHMNRGRHRSRKPVEGLNPGHNHHHHAAAVTATTSTNANTGNSSSKMLLLPNSNSTSSSNVGSGNINGSIVVQGNGGSNNNTISFGHSQGHTLASDASAANTINRMFMNNNNNSNASDRIMQNGPALAMLPPKENPVMIHHHNKHQFPYEESSSSSSRNNNNNNEFGLVTCDSLLNPSNNNRDAAAGTESSQHQQHSLWNFIDDCPKTTTHNSDNRAQHSIDLVSFSSSSQNNTNEKLTLSPLRLSRELELDPIPMGLGVGSYVSDEVVPSNVNNTRQAPPANWIPIAWERGSNHHMGGPLGEVLNLSSGNNSNNNNISGDDHRCGKESNLNLMSDGWDNNSPSIGSSPTGVLQKTAFGSLSNSSAGSSPRGAAENNKGHQDGANLCNDLLGSANA